MSQLRPWIACCIALSLFLQATAGLALPESTAPEAGSIMPCHAEAGLQRSHDEDCSRGCESTPTHESDGPAWGMPGRFSTADQPEPEALTEPWFRSWAPATPARRLVAARAPPPRQAVTPVSRRDILLD